MKIYRCFWLLRLAVFGVICFNSGILVFKGMNDDTFDVVISYATEHGEKEI